MDSYHIAVTNINPKGKTDAYHIQYSSAFILYAQNYSASVSK